MYGTIVMGKRGRRQGDIEEILFGSTAEKVLRGTRVPVVFVPATGFSRDARG
ncbi:MAG: universal stress protein [Blastocatellia bacterium]